jgi:hypothetical protein
VDGDEWKPPRRGGSYLCIRGITHNMATWARLCGIERHTLFMMRRRHGLAYMVQRIKRGLKGDYDPLWWQNRGGKGLRRTPGAPDKRYLTIDKQSAENVT